MANVFHKLVGHGFNTVQDIGRNLGHIVDDGAINSLRHGITDPSMYKGISGATMKMRAGENFGSAVKSSFTSEAGNLDLKQVGTSVVAAGIAGRIISGGGLYKDSRSRTNLMGVPFI